MALYRCNPVGGGIESTKYSAAVTAKYQKNAWNEIQVIFTFFNISDVSNIKRIKIRQISNSNYSNYALDCRVNGAIPSGFPKNYATSLDWDVSSLTGSLNMFINSFHSNENAVTTINVNDIEIIY